MEINTYDDILRAAGATVVCSREFGSYQGDWWALVIYKGETGWVHGWFGSCSHCDSLQSMRDEHRGNCGAHPYAAAADCTDCKKAAEAAENAFVEYGKQLLSEIIPQEEALEKAKRDRSWDSEVDGMVKFIEEGWTNFFNKPN